MILLRAAIVMFLLAVFYIAVVAGAYFLHEQRVREHAEHARQARDTRLREQEERAS